MCYHNQMTTKYDKFDHECRAKLRVNRNTENWSFEAVCDVCAAAVACWLLRPEPTDSERIRMCGGFGVVAAQIARDFLREQKE